MKIYEATERAYRNGYEAGKRDAVKHGRWVDHMVRDWRCSECGERVPRQVHFDGYCYNDKLNYCPNCGAAMDAHETD